MVNWQMEALSRMYPELEQHRDEVSKVLGVERARYASSAQRVSRVVSTLAASGKSIGLEELVKLYESDGVTPEQLVQAGAKVSVPDDFYQRIVAKHASQKNEEKGPRFDVSGLPETQAPLLRGRRLSSSSKRRCSRIFPDGGSWSLDGRPSTRGAADRSPTTGRLAGLRGRRTSSKYGNIVLHKVDGPLAAEVGSKVRGRWTPSEAEDKAHPHRDPHTQRRLEAGPRAVGLAALCVQGSWTMGGSTSPTSRTWERRRYRRSKTWRTTWS